MRDDAVETPGTWSKAAMRQSRWYMRNAAGLEPPVLRSAIGPKRHSETEAGDAERKQEMLNEGLLTG